MNEEIAYKLYISIKSHFNSESYDFFKYETRVKTSQDSYEARRDRVFFKRAAKLYTKSEYLAVLLSNFIYSTDIWIGDIISESGHKRYLEWKKRIDSITYTFKQDLLYIEDYLIEHDLKFNSLFGQTKTYPMLVKMCIEKNISLETFCILHKILNFVDVVDSVIKERILWQKYKVLTLKYSRFLAKKDLDKYKGIFIEKFNVKNLTDCLQIDTIYTNTNIGDL